MRLHSVLIAIIALAFGGIIQASAAAPKTQASSAPTSSAATAPATKVAGNVDQSEKYVVPFQLMTPEERKAFREKIRSLKTPQERDALRRENRKLMEKRAAQRGEKLRPMLSREGMNQRAQPPKIKTPAQHEKHSAPVDQHPAQ